LKDSNRGVRLRPIGSNFCRMQKSTTTGPSERSQDGEAMGGRFLPCPNHSPYNTIKYPSNSSLKDSNRTRATSTHREKSRHGCREASGDGTLANEARMAE
jgi:hypothetical protein